MQSIKVKLKERSYGIITGSGVIKSAGSYISKLGLGSDAYVITNALVKQKCGRRLSDALAKSGFGFKFKLVPDSEKAKSMQQAVSLIKDIAAYDRSKRVFIIALGGGVVGDLAGFVASLYKRGIPYIQVPTTLLAQVDSSIGGKTAVDLWEGKNLVGAFYQPRLVMSDVDLLASLDKRQLACGLAEVIKYAVIKDAQLFSFLEKRYKDVLARKPSALGYIVRRCASIKADIVGADEKEKKGIRTILNFGHTIGHAIEAASAYRIYNHGEAVALGMLAALDISRELGLIRQELQLRVETLIRAVGLPAQIKGLKVPVIIKAYYRDKKFIGARNRFVLVSGIGRTKIVENVPLTLVEETLKTRIC